MQKHGDTSKPTVVLVHGYPDDHHVWDLVVERLRNRFHVGTYDVRGAGGKHWLPRSQPERVAQLIAEHIDRIEARPVAVEPHRTHCVPLGWVLWPDNSGA